MAAIIEQHKLWVISDEIHCDLLRQGQKHIPLGKIMTDYDRLVTCMAPSKTFNLAGLMISNVIIRNAELKETWLSRHYNFDNPLSIAAAQAAYERGGVWLNELQGYLDKNFAFTRDYLAEHLPRAHFRISEATYLAWIDLRPLNIDDRALQKVLIEQQKVAIMPGYTYGKEGNGFVRLNAGCPRSKLEQGVQRLIAGINTLL